MNTKRRTFLKGAGTLTVLLAGGGVWRAYDQGVFSIGQGPAYEPWKNWRTEASQGPLTLVCTAILAASSVLKSSFAIELGEDLHP